MRSLAAATGVAAILAFAPSQAFAADRYIVDSAHSRVAFRVERFGFNQVVGAFARTEGTLDLDRERPENSVVSVTIDVGSLYSGDATRDMHVTGKSWLNAEQFPEITFTSTGIERTGENTARIAGNLLLLGVSRPVVLEATLNRIGVDPSTRNEAAGFGAVTRLKRSDFGLATAMGLVGDMVGIEIELLAQRAPD